MASFKIRLFVASVTLPLLPLLACVSPVPRPTAKVDSPLPPVASRGPARGGPASTADDEYDRLDGTGASGKSVNVIEWEGNLEIHVYPAGSLAGLALKIDRRDKNKPVMVIGYRFNSAPNQQLVRRAILGIDLRDDFRAFREPSADGYDKVVATNSRPWDGLVAYRLDPEPTQLYPDGHPALAGGPSTPLPSDGARIPAASSSATEPEAARDATDSSVDDAGTIRPFFTGPAERRHER